jgi:hypothetical protein
VRAATITPVGPPVAYLARFPGGIGLPRYSGGSAPTLALSRPAQCSLALRPARSADLQKRPFLRVLQTIRRLLIRPECFRLEREFAGPDFHRGEQCTLSRHTEQSGRELTPGGPTTGAQAAALQITGLRPALPQYARRCPQHIQPSAASCLSLDPSDLPIRCGCAMAQRDRRRVKTSPLHLISAGTGQLDNAAQAVPMTTMPMSRANQPALPRLLHAGHANADPRSRLLPINLSNRTSTRLGCQRLQSRTKSRPHPKSGSQSIVAQHRGDWFPNSPGTCRRRHQAKRTEQFQFRTRLGAARSRFVGYCRTHHDSGVHADHNSEIRVPSGSALGR